MAEFQHSGPNEGTESIMPASPTAVAFLNFGKVIGVGKPDEIMASRDVREIYLGIEV